MPRSNVPSLVGLAMLSWFVRFVPFCAILGVLIFCDRLSAGTPEPAPSDVAAVRERLALFDLHVAQGQFASAVADCQAILENPTWRDQPAGELTPYVTSGQECYERIGELIAAYGRDLYGPHERRAAEAVAAAASAADRQALRGAILAFPNSSAARRANSLLGDMHLATHRYARAARAYYQAFSASNVPAAEPAQVDLVLRLMRCYWAGGREGLMQQWFDAGRRWFPDARFGGRGALLGWSDLPDHWGSAGVHGADACPRLDGWLSDVIVPPLVDEVLLLPTMAVASRETCKYVFTYASGGVMAYHAGDGMPAWPEREPTALPPRLLYAAGNRVVFATPFVVWACHIPTGRRLWSVGEHPARADDPGADPEDFPRFRQFAGDGDALVLFRDDGTIMWIDADFGRVYWTLPGAGNPAGEVVLQGDLIAFPINRDGRSLCVIRALGSGEMKAFIPGLENAQIAHVWFLPDERILILAGGVLSAHERDGGTAAWRFADRGPLSASRVVVSFDGIYVSADGRSVTKLRWSDGWRRWHAPALRPTGGEGGQLLVRDGAVFLLQHDGAAVFDADTGVRRFTWFAPPGRDIDHWVPTAGGAVGVVAATGAFAQTQPQSMADVVTAYRLAEAVDGWAVEVQAVGGVADLRAVTAVDGALILQAGRHVIRWPVTPGPGH